MTSNHAISSSNHERNTDLAKTLTSLTWK